LAVDSTQSFRGTGPVDARRHRLVTLAVCVGLFLLAALPRVLDPGRPITWDEPKWVNRSLRFVEALREGDLNETFQVGHPGVTTMWLAGLGMAAHCRLAPTDCRGVNALSASSSGEYASEAALKGLPGVLPAARIPIALTLAAAVVAIFLLARRLIGPPAALLGATLMAIDPFMVAHARVVQLDALTAAFSTLAALALLLGLAVPARRWIAVSAVCAGLAVLSKSAALFLLPFAGLAVAVAALRPWPHRPAVARGLMTYVGWLVGLVFTVFAVWPALWVDAADTLGSVWAMGSGYAQGGHENQSFFLGQVVEDPGPAFYPIATLFRLTPLTCLGLALLALAVLAVGVRVARGRPWAWSRPAWTVAALAAYVLLFAVFMTVGAKKFDRYLLSVFPALDLLAAVGLVWWCGRARAALAARWPRAANAAWLALAGAVLVQAGAVLSYHPHYLAYYNPLLGGGPRAANTVLVGWGEGMDEVADYLNRQPDAATATAVAWVEPGFTPLFEGHTLDFLSFDSLAKADYVVFYVSDIQRRMHEWAHSQFDPLQPDHVVRLHGIEYARVYRNDHGRRLAEYLAGRAGQFDTVLVVGPSVLTRHHDGRWPVTTAPAAEPGDNGAALRDALSALTDLYVRLWYVDYGGICDADDLARFLVAGAGEAFDHHDLAPYGVSVIGVTPRPGPGAEIALPMASGATFGDQLRLESAALSTNGAVSGGALGVATAWRAISDGRPPLAGKLMLRDDEGRVVTQAESGLLDASCQPTQVWPAGATDREWHLLTVPDATAPGAYQLVLVVYNQEDAAALPVTDAAGHTGHELDLGQVTIGAAPASPVATPSAPDPADDASP
jgi:hypothetical protein